MRNILKTIFFIIIILGVAVGSYWLGITKENVEKELPVREQIEAFIRDNRISGKPIKLTKKFTSPLPI